VKTSWHRLWRAPALLIPLGVYASGQLLAPIVAALYFPDLPCVRGAATFLYRLTYGAAGIPAAVAIAGLIAAVPWFRSRRRGGWALAAAAAAVLVAAGYGLGIARWSLLDTPPPVSCAGMNAPTYRPVGCWESPYAFEMNVVPTGRADTSSGLAALGEELRRHRRDKFLFEAFVFPGDTTVARRSNAELFVLARPQLSLFGNVCQQERASALRQAAVQRVAFYRFSEQQRPPVDAFFLPGSGSAAARDVGMAIDYRHQVTLDFRAPADLKPEERGYIARARRATALLNGDLDAEIEAAPGRRGAAVTKMRADLDEQAGGLEHDVPARLLPFARSRVRRFFANYELIVSSEEAALAPPSGSQPARIHTQAFREHRTFFFQEPRVVEPIAYLYINRYPQVFEDEILGVVSWAIF